MSPPKCLNPEQWLALIEESEEDGLWPRISPDIALDTIEHLKRWAEWLAGERAAYVSMADEALSGWRKALSHLGGDVEARAKQEAALKAHEKTRAALDKHRHIGSASNKERSDETSAAVRGWVQDAFGRNALLAPKQIATDIHERKALFSDKAKTRPLKYDTILRRVRAELRKAKKDFRDRVKTESYTKRK